MTSLEPRVGATWRPWGIDTLATVTGRDSRTVTIRYDHDPHLHTLSRAEFFGGMGRTVRRADYERGKTDQALAALTRLEAAYADEVAA